MGIARMTRYIALFTLFTMMLFVAFATDADASGRAFVPDEVFVKFESAYMDTFAGEISIMSGQDEVTLVELKRYPMLENVVLFRIENVASDRTVWQINRDMREIVDCLRSLADVVYAQPNYIYTNTSYAVGTVKASTVPDWWTLLWGFQNSGQTLHGQDEDDIREGVAGVDGNVVKAWSITMGHPSVIVAVADDGVDSRHPAFAGRIIQNDMTNPIQGFMGLEDDEGEIQGNHGTHVAGTIAAFADGELVGVAPRVTLLPINILANPREEEMNTAYGTSDLAIASIFFATENGAKIMNNSWGSERWDKEMDEEGHLLDIDGNIIELDEYGDFLDPEDEKRVSKYNFTDEWEFDMVFREVIQSVEDSMLYIVAAGNDGHNNDTFRSSPDQFGIYNLEDLDGKPMPALKNVINIGAIDNSGYIADFSNYGKQSVHLVAPGWGIYSTLANGEYGMMDGTSMATPYVTGVAALMYSVYPDITPTEAIKILMETGRPIPNAYDRDFIISGNMVDAYAAVKRASEISANKASRWAVEEVKAAIQNDLTTPTVLNNFTSAITREEFCELAVKLYEGLSGKQAPVPSINPFTDTNNPEILKANALGIVNGVSVTSFAPQANVSREEIAVMFYRTLRAIDSSLVAGNYEVTFADKKDISNWALKEIGFISHHNILGGVGDNRVAPKGQATREQALLLVIRTFNQFGVK